MIKRIIIFCCLLSSVGCGETTKPPTETKNEVYICLSGTAYAYHCKLNCQGLKKCTHNIEAVPENVAKEKYKRKPCGYCYK